MSGGSARCHNKTVFLTSTSRLQTFPSVLCFSQSKFPLQITLLDGGDRRRGQHQKKNLPPFFHFPQEIQLRMSAATTIPSNFYRDTFTKNNSKAKGENRYTAHSWAQNSRAISLYVCLSSNISLLIRQLRQQGT